jgi:hypothetical protein
MSTKFADRGFITVNGARLADLQSATLRQTENARVVPTMSRDARNRGFVKGNTDFDITCQIAVQNTLATPKIESLDFETNDIGIQFECGADVYNARGVFLKDAEQSASGVGDEAKKTWNFGALDLVDSVGNSSLFNIQL